MINYIIIRDNLAIKYNILFIDIDFVYINIVLCYLLI